MTLKLKRLTPEKKLSGRLYDEFEGMILRGELQAGDRLPTEAVLCEQLGVSRSLLREVLQQLKGRGLIESTAGRGMFVRSIEQSILEKELQLFAQVEQDPQAFQELVAFRLLLEPQLARLAAEQASPALIDDLEMLLAEMLANRANLSALMEADLDMHLRIAREAGNRFANMILSCLKPLGKRFGHLSYAAVDSVQETLDEHTCLVAAIKARDGLAAEQAMRDHLTSSRAHFNLNPDPLTPAPHAPQG